MKRTPLKRTQLTRKKPLRSHSKLAKKSAKRAAKRKADGSDDPEYRAWILTQPSAVPWNAAVAWDAGIMAAYSLCPTVSPVRVEGHHVDKPKRDRRMVPLYWWLHRETKVSVHSGGGRRKFEQRFGISFDAEIERLNAKYESERGNS